MDSALNPGQETVLSWPQGAVECRVIAAAGAFVLLSPDRVFALMDGIPSDRCTLTFLNGLIPMGWDGSVEFGSEPGELRFKVDDHQKTADRRSSVRLPVFASVQVTYEDETRVGQMLDVSAGGMRFRGAGRFPVGATLHISSQIPNGPLVEGYGVVKIAEPGPVIAVQFSALHAATAQDIGAWTVGQLRASLPNRG